MSKNQKVNDSDSRFLTIKLGQESFAIPLLSVKEVIAMPAVTPIPESPSYFLGIMNLRGQVIPVVDLVTKLKIKGAEKNSESAVVILDLGTTSVGVVVTAVDHVLSLSPDQISDKPQIDGAKESNIVSGVAKSENKLILMLDLEKLFHGSELEKVTRQQKAA